MNQKPLSLKETVKLMTQELSIKEKEVRDAIKIVRAGLISILKQGKAVRVPNIGDFILYQMEEKEGRNPKTGEQVTIKAHTQVKFKASSVLKHAVNGKR